MALIYKYFSQDVFELIFAREGYCGLKFSLPMEYNDPYELFLALDPSVPAEHLATYDEIIGQIPQLPTTCFSRSPIVSPMWAHYAANQSGFVLGFDVERLKECFPECSIRDVTYLEKPSGELHELLARAAMIAKPRYASWLQDAVLSTAYFSKYTEWAYEQETRMVVEDDLVETVEGNAILFLPVDCISSVMMGRNFPVEMEKHVLGKAALSGFKPFHIKIGKSYPVPYMVDEDGRTHIFLDRDVKLADYVCDSCSEPITEGGEMCPWCRISEGERIDAAMRNPFRILDHHGRLEEYLAGVADIKRNHRKRK